MSGLRPESHVAQQFRREKLRIQNISHHYQDFPHNLEHLSSHQGFNMDLLQVRNVRNANNMLDEPAAIYSSEIPNFSFTSNPSPRLEYQELGEPSRLMMHHQYGSFPHQTSDLNIVNYASNNNNTFHAYEPNNGVYANIMVQNENPSALYQSAWNDVAKIASLMQQNGQGIWEGDASTESEQQHQPSFGNQNHLNQLRFGWTNPIPLCFTDKKIDVDSNPQSLSLSLSSSSNACVNSQFEEGSVSRDCGKSPQDMVSRTSFRNVGPLGPFTGYATILKSSRFLKTSQDLLEEFCYCVSGKKLAKRCDLSERVSEDACGSTSTDVVTVAVNQTGVASKASNSGSSSSMFHVSSENRGADWGAGSTSCGVSSLLDYQQKKAKLLYMQEEVTRRYKQYHQQMQMVVSSFESVAGLSSATPYMSMAFKSVSKHFRCLNNSISDQVKLISQVLGEDLTIPNTSASSKIDTNNMALRLRCMDQSLQNNKSSRGAITLLEQQLQHHHVWRPQRGLPERAVAILRAWLFEHFLHPYPTDTDKHMLAMQTGLSRNQVSNWFINARVRVWKPMVEEIHTLETKTTSAKDNTIKNEGTCGTEIGSTSMQPIVDKSLSKFGMHTMPENQIQSMEMGSSINAEGLNAEQWSQEKRSKLEYQMSSGMDGTVMGLLPCRNGGIEVGGLGSVSLTLGLRHGFEGMQHQHQQLQEEQLRHHLGGQMIHDFVG